MSTPVRINHVTLIVRDLDEAVRFYSDELGLESVPAFEFDYPTQFFKLGHGQQLHLTEWEDAYSFRGHLCLEVSEFNDLFQRMKAQGRIDTNPWGRVRRLPDGAMQMFVRDPSGNLLEISAPKHVSVDPAIFEDEALVESGEGGTLYVSNRNDPRGLKSATATLYHAED